MKALVIAYNDKFHFETVTEGVVGVVTETNTEKGEGDRDGETETDRD